MAIVNAACMTVSGAPGTGTVTLGSAVASFLSFSDAGCVDGQTYSYVLTDGSAREGGVGTYDSGGTFTRDTVSYSTAGGTTKIDAGASAVISITALAADIGGGGSSALIGVTVEATGTDAALIAADLKFITLPSAYLGSGEAISNPVAVHTFNVSTIGYDIASLSFPDLRGVLADAYINSSWSLPVLEFVAGEVTCTADYALSSGPVTLPSLQYVGGDFLIGVGGGATDVNLPVLKTVVGAFSIEALWISETVSIPELTTTGNLALYSWAYVTSFELPSLITTANLSANVLSSLTSLSFPALKKTGNFSIGDCTLMSSLSMPLVEVMGEIIIYAPALVSFSLPELKKVNGNILIEAALDQTSVDDLLVKLASLDGTGGTTSYDYAFVTITGTSAAPSATGLSAKATLEGRSCAVTTN